jgi:hypothetical protein
MTLKSLNKIAKIAKKNGFDIGDFLLFVEHKFCVSFEHCVSFPTTYCSFVKIGKDEVQTICIEIAGEDTIMNEPIRIIQYNFQDCKSRQECFDTIEKHLHLQPCTLVTYDKF